MDRPVAYLRYCFLVGLVFGMIDPAPLYSTTITTVGILPQAESFPNKAAARAYKRKHGIKGKIRRQPDGRYAIETRYGAIYQDQELAEIVYPTPPGEGIVFAVLVTAPPLRNDSGMRTGPDKVPPLTFWQRLNGGIVAGAKYSPQGYYIGPAPLAGAPPGPGKIFKALRIAGGLKIGRSITQGKAIERLQKGQDVYVTSRSAAKKLMKKASGMRTFRESAHGKGFFDHFHDAYRKLKGHSFFGKPKS